MQREQERDVDEEMSRGGEREKKKVRAGVVVFKYVYIIMSNNAPNPLTRLASLPRAVFPVLFPFQSLSLSLSVSPSLSLSASVFPSPLSSPLISPRLLSLTLFSFPIHRHLLLRTIHNPVHSFLSLSHSHSPHLTSSPPGSYPALHQIIQLPAITSPPIANTAVTTYPL